MPGEKQAKKIEKRKNVRHEIDFIVSLYRNGTLVAPNNRFKNISTAGALISISREFDFIIGERYILILEEDRLLQEFNLTLDPIEALVKHKDQSNEFLVGFSFCNITDRNKRIIKKIIDNKFMLKNFPKSWQITK
ncbi:PilZ domain-containing protein [Pigmentibacter sp. JX0631]|uniref:PilZ domain-containing protein n=1 Tax=Pigmentibacter sp. JX0631 TaxID=2976982 RepID=UPI0024686D6D|nr:PilZ domain-containing protein [Pigmentibacter sp. JX0631]WGL61505.1 PilZ domain-containing protein [Pigmentibacter sp. JX0631]